MTAHTIDVEDLSQEPRKGRGLRVREDSLLSYDLLVLADDVESVVGAAGGWLCDRVRAGWRVTVLAPTELDPRPLTILGLGTAAADTLIALPPGRRPTALAVDARLAARHEATRDMVLRAVDDTRTEVTMWGESSLFAADRRFRRVHHRLSAAARAFKGSALRSCGVPVADLTVEAFHSAALWYPPDGTDLALG